MPHTIALAAAAMCVAGSAHAEYFTVGPVPASAPQGFSQVFSKHVDVLGCHVYASSNTPNSKVLHCANVLAQWIDNDEDGVPDDPTVNADMVALHASMVMWPSEQAMENAEPWEIIPDWYWDEGALQGQFGNETNLGYPENGEFDATLEECLHLVTWGGFSRTYPSVFGEFHGSDIANQMDAVISGGWYHYGDPTCDYACKVTEFHYWALTSMLGAQDYPWRIPDIADEWELPTAALMQQHAAGTVAILSNTANHQATVLPDGSYDPQPNDCPGDFDGDGGVGANDLLAMLAAWGQSDPDMDFNGDGVVNVPDLLDLLAFWGDC